MYCCIILFHSLLLPLCGFVFCGVIRSLLYHLVEEERAGCFTSLLLAVMWLTVLLLLF